MLTLGVLAGCYRGHGRKNSSRNVEDRTMVTHAVEGHGSRKALCGFNADKLVDEYSDPAGNDKQPTCKRCSEKWLKRKLGL